MIKLIGSFGLNDRDAERIKKTIDEFEKKENIVRDVDSDKYFELLSVKATDTEMTVLKKLGFNETEFLKGVEEAVDIVSYLFDKKNFDVMDKVLSEKLFQQLKVQIDELEKQDRFLKSELISIKSKKIDSVRVEKPCAYIVLSIQSEQINYVEDKEGNVIYGNKKDRNLVDEIWTFSREIPNKKETFWIVDDVKTV
jgi:predicted lipid-binding transport protein (Tim44 family)